jgi:hypothetical protein
VRPALWLFAFPFVVKLDVGDQFGNIGRVIVLKSVGKATNGVGYLGVFFIVECVWRMSASAENAEVRLTDVEQSSNNLGESDAHINNVLGESRQSRQEELFERVSVGRWFDERTHCANKSVTISKGPTSQETQLRLTSNVDDN